METFIFATYILSLVAFSISLYAIIEVLDLKRQNRRKIIEKRLDQIVQQTKRPAKGLWN
jgi:hypothetical protein